MEAAPILYFSTTVAVSPPNDAKTFNALSFLENWISEFNAVPIFSPLRPVASDNAVIKPTVSSKLRLAFVAEEPVLCKAANNFSVVTAALSAVIFNLSITRVKSLASKLNCCITAINPSLASVASNSATFNANTAASVAFIVSDQSIPDRAKLSAISLTFSKVCPYVSASSYNSSAFAEAPTTRRNSITRFSVFIRVSLTN